MAGPTPSNSYPVSERKTGLRLGGWQKLRDRIVRADVNERNEKYGFDPCFSNKTHTN